MITPRPFCSWYSSQAKRAFTLIEVVGVLAVIALLSALVLPALTKQVDATVSDQESRTLQAFSDAFQRVVLRRSYVPGPAGSDWVTNIANELALDSSEVVTNGRHQRRFFLIDPSLRIAGAGLPYLQGPPGSPTQPKNARVMLLSSLGPAFPGGMKDGVDPDFDTIWKAPERSVPTGVTSLSGWSGNGDDLKIQRVDLSPLFVQLTLTSMGSTLSTIYTINDATDPTALMPSSSVSSYYLQNSVLGLFTNAPPYIDSKQILVRDSFFVYYANQWQSTIPGGFSAIAEALLGTQAAVPTNQVPVIQSFTNYFTAYAAWAGTDFTTNYDGATAAYSYMTSQVAILRSAFPP